MNNSATRPPRPGNGPTTAAPCGPPTTAARSSSAAGSTRPATWATSSSSTSATARAWPRSSSSPTGPSSLEEAKKLRARIRGRRPRHGPPPLESVNTDIATGEVEVEALELQRLRRLQGPAVRRRRPAPGLRGAALQVPLPRPAPAEDAAPHPAPPRGRPGRPELPEPARLSRDRDAHPGQSDARGGPGLPRPQPRLQGPVLRPAPVAPAVQADAHDRRVRPLFPDRPLLPRRGPPGRPPARVHPDRHRDELHRPGRLLRPQRRPHGGPLRPHRPEGRDGRSAGFPTPRPWRSTARTSPTCACRSRCATSRPRAGTARPRSSKNVVAAGGELKGLLIPGAGSLSRGQLDKLGRKGQVARGQGPDLDQEAGRLEVVPQDGRGRLREDLGGPRRRRRRPGPPRRRQEGSPPSRPSARSAGPGPSRTRPDATASSSSGSPTSRSSSGARRRSASSPCTTPSPRPYEEDLPLLETDPARVRAKAYDLVLNGVEVGGGSIRIHDMDLQRRIFKTLGLTDEETQDEVRLLPRGPGLRRAAPRRHRPRLRPPGHAPGRRGIHPRGHPLPQDDRGPRPHDRLARRRSTSASSTSWG